MKILYTFLGTVVVVGVAWVLIGMPTSLGLGGWGEADPAKNTQGIETADDTPMQPVEPGASDFTGSMQELIARGGSWTCSVSSTAGGVASNGTTYAANGMVRSDFTSEIPQVGSIESHMIVRDGLAYTWTSMMNQGFKFPISEGDGEAEVSAEVAAPVHQDYDFSCSPWVADASRFALPAGITF